jgi:hypothetical protein
MHTVIFLAVEASDENEAREVVDGWMEETDLGDWWEIGGRWSGALGGRDVICAADSPTAFMEAVDQMLAVRLERINELRQRFVGPDPDLAISNMFGFPIDDVEVVTQRVHDRYRQEAAEFARLLESRDLPQSTLLGHHLWKFGALVAGYANVDAAVYDITYGSSDMAAIRERVSENPAEQFLVVVDVHT